MAQSTLHVAFTNSNPLSEYWVEISQVEPPDDSASLGDVAKLIDSLYGIDPCNEYDLNEDDMQTGGIDEVTGRFVPDASEEEQEAANTEAKEEFFNDTIKEFAGLGLCDIDGAGNYNTQIIVKLSHGDGDYRLVLTNGLITRTVLSSFTPDPDRPDERVPALVYLVDVTVFGNAENEPGDCRAICFYKYKTDEIELSKPSNDGDENDRNKYCNSGSNFAGSDDSDDEVTCFETVATQYLCECSGGLAYETEEEVVVTCPETMTKCSRGMFSDAYQDENGKWHCSSYMGSRTILGDYVPCDIVLRDPMGIERARQSDESILADPAYYEKQCCHAPSGTLPKCQTKYRKNPGEGLSDEQQQSLIAKYGYKLDLIPVSPEDGDCGTIKTVISDIPQSCCEFAVPLVIDSDSLPTAISDNSQGLIRFVDAPNRSFAVTVRGEGFFANESRTSKKVQYNGGGGFWVYTANACGPASITVEDGCSAASVIVFSTDGSWYTWPKDYDSCNIFSGSGAVRISKLNDGGLWEKYSGNLRIQFDVLWRNSAYTPCYCEPTTIGLAESECMDYYHGMAFNGEMWGDWYACGYSEGPDCCFCAVSNWGIERASEQVSSVREWKC